MAARRALAGRRRAGPTPWRRLAQVDRARLTRRLVWGSVSLFVLGLLVFATAQTQHLFRDTFDFEVSPGKIPRNDGGILFGSTLAALGIGLTLLALSDQRPTRAVPKFLGFVSLFVLVLFSHFAIYVNGLIAPGTGVAVKASFLFHDTASSLPIATFSLTLVTALALCGLLLLAVSLIAPRLLEQRFHRLRTLDEHRTRLLVLTLVLVGAGSAYLAQFVGYALRSDANPSGDFFATNLVVVYYLLALTLLGALVTVIWRSVTLLWGDLRDRPSRTFRRSYAYLTTIENWLWGILLVLTGIIFLADPIYVPNRAEDRVFVVNSRGTSFFFLAVFGLFLVQRWASRAYLGWLAEHHARVPVVRMDRLAALAIVATAAWFLPKLLFIGSDLSPLARLAIRLGLVSLVLTFFAVRIDLARFEAPRLARPGSPLLLLAAFTASVTVGIMLWGVGNSVTTVYTSTGGFVTVEKTLLQPYATGIRFLGSIFIAAPLTAGLALLTTRHGTTPNPWSVIVSGFSIIAAMNLLLTVNAAVQIDAVLRQRDVLIGFAIVSAASPLDRTIMLILWCVTTGLGFVSAYLLLRKGTDLDPAKDRPSVA